MKKVERVRPQAWSMVAAAVLFAGAVVLGVRGYPVVAIASAVSAVAWLFFGSLPSAHRHNASRIAWLTAAASLATTWTTAMLFALLYAAFAADGAGAEVWIPIWLLTATNVGGLLAVFRSAQTRTETSAALREMSDLRIAVLSAPVVEAAERASRAKTLADLSESLGSMLQLAVNLSLLPRAVDQASLWALDDENGEWFICAATTPPHQQSFRQRVVTEAAPGAGMVANLAAGAEVPDLVDTTRRDGDVYLVAEGLHAHPWFLTNPAAKHPAEGIAVVLLRRKFQAVGALCFTWGTKVVPVEGSRAEEMIDILGRWAQAFGVGLSRLYRLREELKRA
ncbi:MAG: hypothetical protein ACKV2T_24640 [Kofleriaceae bacterium]